MPPKIGVLAGGGRLPAQVIEACRNQQRDHFVVAFRGFTDPATVQGIPHEWMDLGRVGAILRRLHEENVHEAVLAGPVRRPESLLDLRLDWRGFRLLLRMLTGWNGDDHVLSRVVREIESDGIKVVGAEAVAPQLLMPAGKLGTYDADAKHHTDIALGVKAARELGERDRGQAVLVAHGRVLDRETRGGTAALLAAARGNPAARGGVLIKMAKPAQERRVDLPSIGVETVTQAAAAGLAGVALEAGGSLVIDRPEVARAADATGLFVVGVATP